MYTPDAAVTNFLVQQGSVSAPNGLSPYPPPGTLSRGVVLTNGQPTRLHPTRTSPAPVPVPLPVIGSGCRSSPPGSEAPGGCAPHDPGPVSNGDGCAALGHACFAGVDMATVDVDALSKLFPKADHSLILDVYEECRSLLGVAAADGNGQPLSSRELCIAKLTELQILAGTFSDVSSPTASEYSYGSGDIAATLCPLPVDVPPPDLSQLSLSSSPAVGDTSSELAVEELAAVLLDQYIHLDEEKIRLVLLAFDGDLDLAAQELATLDLLAGEAAEEQQRQAQPSGTALPTPPLVEDGSLALASRLQREEEGAYTSGGGPARDWVAVANGAKFRATLNRLKKRFPDAPDELLRATLADTGTREDKAAARCRSFGLLERAQPWAPGPSRGGGGGLDAHTREANDIRRWEQGAREKAHGLAHGMKLCFAEAAAAHQAGNGQHAKEMSNKGREYKAKLEHVNQQINKMKRYDSNRHTVNQVTEDLHGLSVRGALERVDELLKLAEGASGTTHIKFITGKGYHSAGYIPRLLPAVKNHLEECGVACQLGDGYLIARVNSVLPRPLQHQLDKLSSRRR